MKRKMNLLSCTVLLLLLCACGAAESAEPVLPAEELPRTEEGTDGEAAVFASEVAPRPESTELILLVEGQEERIPVTLWVEEQFSLYLPSSGWQSDGYGSWAADENGDVRLFVRFYEGKSPEEGVEELAVEQPDYAFSRQEEDSWQGYDSVHNMTLAVAAREAADGVWALCSQYPTEAEEGFGARLAALTDTFELS